MTKTTTDVIAENTEGDAPRVPPLVIRKSKRVITKTSKMRWCERKATLRKSEPNKRGRKIIRNKKAMHNHTKNTSKYICLEVSENLYNWFVKIQMDSGIEKLKFFLRLLTVYCKAEKITLPSFVLEPEKSVDQCSDVKSESNVDTKNDNDENEESDNSNIVDIVYNNKIDMEPKFKREDESLSKSNGTLLFTRISERSSINDSLPRVAETISKPNGGKKASENVPVAKGFNFGKKRRFTSKNTKLRNKKITVTKKRNSIFKPEVENITQGDETDDVFLVDTDTEKKKCILCKTVIRNLQMARNHVRTHRENTYDCVICGKTVGAVNGCPGHSYSQKAKYTILCDHCEFQSNSLIAYESHIKSQHPDEAAKINFDSWALFVCGHCGQDFQTERELQAHAETHLDLPQSWICESCGKKFSSKRFLKIHQQCVHAPKEYQCPQCGNLFQTKDTLRAHISRIHKQVKKVLCCYEGCSYKFFRNSELLQHIRVHHTKEKLFECEWKGCTKTFRAKYHMLVHQRIHTGEKPLTCPHCDYRARQRTALNWHMRKHNAEGTQEIIKEPTKAKPERTAASKRKKAKLVNHSNDNIYIPSGTQVMSDNMDTIQIPAAPTSIEECEDGTLLTNLHSSNSVLVQRDRSNDELLQQTVVTRDLINTRELSPIPQNLFMSKNYGFHVQQQNLASPADLIDTNQGLQNMNVISGNQSCANANQNVPGIQIVSRNWNEVSSLTHVQMQQVQQPVFPREYLPRGTNNEESLGVLLNSRSVPSHMLNFPSWLDTP